MRKNVDHRIPRGVRGEAHGEYHGVRATIEADVNSTTIEGAKEATACGIGFSNGTTWNCATFLVTSRAGTVLTYKLDRWD
jgi:hypothetical protein